MGLFRFQEPEKDEGLGPPPDIFQFRRPNFRLPSGLMRWVLPLVLLLIAFIIASIAKGIYANVLWFDSVQSVGGTDYLSVYGLRIVTRIWLFFAGAGVFLLFFAVNLLVAWRLTSRSGGEPSPLLGDVEPAVARRVGLAVAVAVALFLAVIFGVQAAGQWDNLLLFMNSQPFGVEDPAFNQDIGFYVFRLPMLNFIVGWSMAVVILTTIVVTGIYVIPLVLGGGSGEPPPLARSHVSLLLVVVLGLFIWRYWLSRFGLVYGEGGAAFGASYTDINARLPVIYILMAMGTLTAGLILVSIVRRGLLFLPIGATVLWVVVAIIAGQIYPATVQRFQVEPNELAQEEEFIERNIAATRFAYGLDTIEVRPFPAREEGVTAAEIAANSDTVDNIRIWDHRPLRQTLNQLQAIGPLYDFLGVDVDRYLIDGELRQVMLSARELDQTSLPADKKSWVNSRLKFTHGFGLAMVPVNKVAPGGLPTYFVKDIPPSGELSFEGSGQELIDQPRIYYGEIPEHYVIVNSTEEEFDFPVGETGSTTVTYESEGGVKLSSFFRRLVYAWEFGDTNILISGAITDESRLLYRRNISDRVSEIAPFLALDRDPYLVVADGQLFWIQDAYTHTDRYPYSTRSGGLNYIRNSVKVVLDAFDGTVTFYLIEPDDPIAQVYNGIYPDLFTPFEEMPVSLRAHIRYPQDLFEVQSELYLRYHITNARDFFLGEDFWDIPTELVEQETEQTLEPYYVIMQLPGEAQEEFVLMRPFRPRGERKNSIAWLAARSDGDQYGKLLLFRFPDEVSVLGPSQVEASITTEPEITEQFTLWKGGGSQVIRGNLLMIPIGEGILFVEPIYLRAAANALPSLERVVVANGTNIAMEVTLERALQVVLGRAAASEPTVEPPDGEPTPTATPGPDETPAATPTAPPSPTPGAPDDVASLIQQANDSFARAQELLQQGDFAGYGEEIERLEAILQDLADLAEFGQ